jgi:hypothetical protein
MRTGTGHRFAPRQTEMQIRAGRNFVVFGATIVPGLVQLR